MEDQSARSSKSRDRHQQRPNNANPTKKSHNLLHYDTNQLLPPSGLPRADTSVNQVLNETNKIVKMGVQREFVLREKDKAIKDASETIDNLRKNIIQIQMEYEKLDQTYQREISYRSELIKRTDTTRGMVESAVHYSNILATSVKQLEDDKLKIAEFYSIIYNRQLEVEEKFKLAETMLTEQENVLQKSISFSNENHDKEIFQARETVSQLNKKAAILNNKLKSEMEQNQKLSAEISDLKNAKENLAKSLTEANALYQKKKFNESSFLKLKAAYKALTGKKIKEEKIIKDKYKKDRRNLREKIKEAEKLHQDVVAANSILKNQMDDLENELKIVKEEAEKFRNQIEEKEKVIEFCKNENQQFQEKNRELIQNIENIKTDAEKTYLALEENYKNILQVKEKLESDLNDLKTEKNTEIEKLNEKMVDLEKDFNIVKEKKEDLENQIFVNLDILEKERSDHLKAVKNYEDKIKTLEAEISDFKDKETTLQTLVNEKSAELDKMVNDLSIRDVALKDLNETKGSVVELNLAIKKLEDSNDALNAELKAFKEENKTMKDKLDMEKSNCKMLKSEKSKLEKTSKNLQEELEIEQQSYQKIKSDYDKIRAELYEAKKLNESAVGKDERISQLKKLLDEAEASLEAHKVINKKLETDKGKEISQLKRELKLLRETKEKEEGYLKAEIESVKNDMTTKLEEKDAEINKLQDEIEKLLSRSPIKPATMEKESEFSKPIIPERRTTAVTFANTVAPARRFLTTPRKVFGGPSEPKTNQPPASKKDVYEFDSDSSLEQYKPDEVLKAFNKFQKRDPAPKKRKL